MRKMSRIDLAAKARRFRRKGDGDDTGTDTDTGMETETTACSLDEVRAVTRTSRVSPWTRFTKLNWTKTPSRFLPHGATGIVMVIIGAVVTFGNIFGYHAPEFLHIPYAISVMLNAAAGMRMVHMAEPDKQFLFRVGAMIQLALAWVILRMDGGLNWLLLFPIGKVVDLVACVVMFGAKISMWRGVAQTQLLPVVVATRIGVLALALLSIYPVHWAVGGQEWLDCVCERWPVQKRGFLQYVFIPTTWMIGLMFFGASLLNRKIITPLCFGLVFGLGVVGTVLLNVLMQEVWIPYISTQRLYIPCPMPPVDSWQYEISEVFDLSPVAQRSLRSAGVDMYSRSHMYNITHTLV